MNEKHNKLADSEVNKIVGGNALDQLVSPAPSTGPLPCVDKNRSDLPACPHSEAEKLCFNCEDCLLNKPAEAPIG